MSSVACSQHSTAQHSTAQHSTAQHSTAQHSMDFQAVAGKCVTWPGLQGVKGVACIWRANDEFVDRFNLPLELPMDVVRDQGYLPVLPQILP